MTKPAITSINRCNVCHCTHHSSEQIQFCMLTHFVAYLGRVDHSVAEIVAASLVDFVGGAENFKRLTNEILANNGLTIPRGTH